MKVRGNRPLYGISFLLFTLFIAYLTPNTAAHRLKHYEARKLLKLLLAAAFFTPPGFGIVPIPLPVPVPFAVESVKPPIIHPFSGHHGIGGFGGIGNFGGGLLHGAASEQYPMHQFMENRNMFEILNKRNEWASTKTPNPSTQSPIMMNVRTKENVHLKLNKGASTENPKAPNTRDFNRVNKNEKAGEKNSQERD